MRNIAVIGIGQTQFGEHWDMSLRALAAQAGSMAIKDANVDVEALYVGNMSAGRLTGQEHVGALVADALNLNGIPATRCEGACASGSLAFREAYMAVASGRYDVVMALGAEKMTDLKTPEVATALMGAGDQEWEYSAGITFAGLYALMAKLHMHKFGTTREQLAMVSVNNHKNAAGNKLAQFQSPITVEDVLSASLVADPLGLLDCSPITDGSAAIVLASEKVARKMNPVWVLASEQASDTIALHDRKSFTEMAATIIASKSAYKRACVQPEKINFAEVHDCFSINEILAIEDLGFCKKGEGGKFVEAGEISLNGKIPINISGGLKAIGHPVGATGIRQICDIVRQFRGTSNNSLKNPEFGLALNIGGSGATAVASIFGREPNAA